jgi:predicted HicB family RNase H-like nuclease
MTKRRVEEQTERMEGTLTVRADKTLLRVLAETAEREHRSSGNLVRRILTDWSEGRLVSANPGQAAAA